MKNILGSQKRGRRGAVVTVLGLLLMAYPYTTYGTPITVPLKRTASSVKFGIDAPSPTLKMNGSFSDFRGSLKLESTDLTRSAVKLSLNLQSARLPPDQVLQAIFLQTALARLRDRNATFESTGIARSAGNTYLVTGTYTWRGKTKEAVVPVEVLRVAPSLTEIRLLMGGSMKDKEVPPELAALGAGSGGSKGWVRANFIFAPS